MDDRYGLNVEDGTGAVIALAPGRIGARSIRAEVDAELVQRLCRTDGFDVQGLLVVRRGSTIPVRLSTRSLVKEDAVSASLLYEEGKDEIALDVVNVDSKITGAAIEVAVPVNAPVTMYMLKVRGRFRDETLFEVELSDRVVVLFNAWSPEDDVFMPDESWRQEYVLSSSGRLYIGDKYGDAWNLALYQEETLRAVLFLLETVSKLTLDQKRNPVFVARNMSALVNSQDEDGVLEGRWYDDYSDGKFPWFWTGSGAILKQYYQSGGKPVKYGQCWVFSGVLLTVLRVLGIPSRSVTNFASAHDTNRNRTIDEYYGEDGEKLDYLSSGGDSIWNFHVWNDAWMKRPDLPAGFDGWQALDATPQEESPQGGYYRTGPAPLKAIKEGNSVVYDTNFIIAEVNADIKKYTVDADGVPKLFQVDTKTVGQDMSTKSVGSHRREDVTGQYKYPEGTDWERRALYNGYEELRAEERDVEFFVPEMEYEFGQEVRFVVSAKNKAKQHRIVGRITCQAVTYSGRLLEDVDTIKVDVKVNKGKTEDISMTVNGEIFSKHPHTKVYLKFVATLSVSGTSQMYNETVMTAPHPPKLSIEGPDKITLGQSAKLLFSFTNTLPVVMKDVILNMEVDMADSVGMVQNLGSIEPKSEIKYALDITGTKLGSYMVSASLASDKVEHVTGEKEVEVVSVGPRIVPFDTLTIESVDLNLEANQVAHFTDAYEYDGLVVRRGQSFTITITTSKPVPTGSKVVTRAIFQLVAKSIFERTSFDVKAVSSAKGNTLNLELTPPADVEIGEYELLLTVDDAGMVSALHKNIKLVILFNPWCTDDSCHFPETSELEEYVLNTKGRIWVGAAGNNYGRPWQFSQFNKDTLEVALWILGHLEGKKRSNPIEVSRIVSAVSNDLDEDGILVGNWSGDYSGGTSPTDWYGSAAILAEFNQTKQPVKFGQCWVFSGIQTSLFRCLGLPARSVSNFNSAHDTDFNRAIDKYYDKEGNPLSNADSIWNFHVWNEAWMARSDLPTGFGGWQALDATPQEESPQGGGFRLGPASCRAIKLGMRMDYDVEFVISEVNADIRYYMQREDGSNSLVRVNTYHVGKTISTKAVGSSQRNDITLHYKFREGSTSERAALLASTEAQKVLGVAINTAESVLIGQDFKMMATVTNKSSSERTLRVRFYGRAALYTGAPGQMVKDRHFKDIFQPQENKVFELAVRDIDYLRILEDGNFINLTCIVTDDEDDQQAVMDMSTIRLKTPDIVIVVKKELKLYQAAEITASFTNPLNKSLTGGKFELRGDGFLQDATITTSRPVYSHETVNVTFKSIAMKKGSFELVVRFSSRELTDIMGDADLEVLS